MSGYINPAFSGDSAVAKQHLQDTSIDSTSNPDMALIQKSPVPRNGALSKDSTEIEMFPAASAPRVSNTSDNYQRRASVADIAIAFATATVKPGSSAKDSKGGRGRLSLSYWQRSYRFTHPFGHTTNILDEILGSGYMEDGGKASSATPAKLIVWVIFACFLVGMAGAIILGAETKKTSDENVGVSSVNVSKVISG